MYVWLKRPVSPSWMARAASFSLAARPLRAMRRMTTKPSDRIER